MQTLILAGGRGTRSADPALPKILQSVQPGKTLLSLHLDNLQRAGLTQVTLLVSHGANLVVDAVELLKGDYPNLSISFAQDKRDGGTAGAVWDAIQPWPRGQECMLILGDTAVVAPLEQYVNRWRASTSQVAVLCHPNLHTADSDRVRLDANGNVLTFASKSMPTPGPGYFVPVTGVVLFKLSDNLRDAPSSKDASEWLLRSGLTANSCTGLVTSHYLKDSGTPARLEKIRTDFLKGVSERRGKPSRPAIILDRDGTVIPNTGTGRRTIGKSDVTPSVARAIAQANTLGVPVFIATNQPGIAKGEITFEDVLTTQRDIQDVLEEHGSFIDDFVFCPHHPSTGHPGEIAALKHECECRKPAPGMLHSLAIRHGLDLAKSVFIGDDVRDQGAADAVGMFFLYASFDLAIGTSVEKAILGGLERIVNDNH